MKSYYLLTIQIAGSLIKLPVFLSWHSM